MHSYRLTCYLFSANYTKRGRTGKSHGVTKSGTSADDVFVEVGCCGLWIGSKKSHLGNKRYIRGDQLLLCTIYGELDQRSTLRLEY